MIGKDKLIERFNNTLIYKGYLGSVAFSEKDGIFFGKVEGVNGLVNFEGVPRREIGKHPKSIAWRISCR